MEGKTINGFVLKHKLGEGGMAEVWYAENNIGKKSAVKILDAGLANKEQIVERFKNEAKIMIALDHPNVRQAYDYCEIDGRPAIIQEYLEGNDMETLIHEGCKISEDLLVRWWDQLVAALNYTHALGFVHRDIKPSNIFIDKYGNVKLMDFGIAKIVEDVSLTMTGTTLGTRLYMSPEQVKDPKRVGYKSDNYSLAVSYVHLLTGKATYDTTTSSDFDVQLQIVSKPLDLSNVPENWRNFLLPYLEKDPDKRAELKPFVNNVSAAASAKPATPVSSGDGTRVDEAPIKKAESKPKSTVKSTTASKPTETKKSRKGLWIGLGVGAAVVAVAIILVVVFLSGNTDKNESYNGHDYVDLGLPSGTLWATCNVGANSPEEYGDYFSWGETFVKENYTDDDTSKYTGRNNLTTLEASDDAATFNWGSCWRMPTQAEMQELYDNCTREWTVQNGVYGGKFIGPNGNSIFLPAAGNRKYRDFCNVGSEGIYWSSSLDSVGAWRLFFNSDFFEVYYSSLYCGLSVRPVYDVNVVFNSAESSADAISAPTKTQADDTRTPGSSDSQLVSQSETKQIVSNNTLNGHEFVDLGLSVNWATCNVGASSPGDNGNYYAWGETKGKSTYSWSTYKYCKCIRDDVMCRELTKYCNDNGSGYNGFSDNLNMLQPEDDAATANWGKGWRTPTEEELRELIERCSWTWTTYGGNKGRLVTGPNGNSIFLPAAGAYDNSGHRNASSWGEYWSSSLDTDDLVNAWSLDFDLDNYYMLYYGSRENRCEGLSVRAVCASQN